MSFGTSWRRFKSAVLLFRSFEDQIKGLSISRGKTYPNLSRSFKSTDYSDMTLKGLFDFIAHGAGVTSIILPEGIVFKPYTTNV